MNRKYSCFLLLLNLILISGMIGAYLHPEKPKSVWEQIAERKQEKTDVVKTSYEKNYYEIEMQSISEQHNLTVSCLKREQKYILSEEDLTVLYKIVQAEAGNEDDIGKILVANVILNRMNDESFPNTIKDVVYQKENGISQFSPVSNGTIDTVTVTEETTDAVNRAIYGEDYSEGALYFASRKYASKDKMKWFDNHLTSLFTHGGHEFFM